MSAYRRPEPASQPRNLLQTVTFAFVDEFNALVVVSNVERMS